MPALAALLALALVLVTGSAVSAADPVGTIGGTLVIKASGVTLHSGGTLPVTVEMVAEGPFSLSPSTFTLDPGDTQEMSVSGEASGVVLARMQAVTTATGDAASVVLSTRFPTPAPPAPLPLGPILAGLLALLALALVLRRLRPWEYRIARKEGTR